MAISSLTDWGNYSPCCDFPTKDYCVYRYASWKDSVTFDQNISTFNFILTVKRNKYDKTVIKQLSLNFGLTVTGTTLFINTLIDFSDGGYVYDLIGVTSTGDIIPYRIGKLKVKQNIGVITSAMYTIPPPNTILTGLVEVVITAAMAANIDVATGRVRVLVPALAGKLYTLNRRGTGPLLSSEFVKYPDGFEIVDLSSQPVEGEIFIAAVYG